MATRDLPAPPEAQLIRRYRLAAGLSIAAAAERTGGKVSGRRWTQIEQGFIAKGGKIVPTMASEGALAHMAAAVGVTPKQLEDLDCANCHGAAEVLRAIREKEANDASDFDIEAFLLDPSIPIERRRRAAARFLEVVSYFLRGEEPPPLPPAVDDDHQESA